AQIRTVPCIVEKKTCALVSIHDLTDRHQLEEEHIRNEKLESIGLLAGGIAHDFNNSLSAVMGLVSIARHKSEGGSELESILHKAESAAVHARELTSQLLSFSREGAPDKQLYGVRDLLLESVNFGLSGSGTNVDFDIPVDIATVLVDRGQFHQVVSNLVINAKQAMNDKGELIVRARNVVWNNELGARARGPYVRIDIEDSGPGIPADIREKVLTPYFTTKETGTGLGLTTSLAIMIKHDGWLEFDSETGKGTEFSLYFPASSEIVDDAPETSDRVESTIPKGSGAILVMDDDPDVQATYRLALIELGYSVETVRDGDTAVARWLDAIENGTPFDLAILDLTIPGGMGGIETITRLRELDPGAVAIVASGYNHADVISDFRSAGFAASLKKPFTMQQIGKVLAGIMPASRESADPNLPR
ncbi:MAG: ATP-binding protein, partial [Planctomycetota bacterium]